MAWCPRHNSTHSFLFHNNNNSDKQQQEIRDKFKLKRTQGNNQMVASIWQVNQSDADNIR